MKKNKKLKGLKGVSGGMSMNGFNAGGENTNFHASDSRSETYKETVKQHNESNIQDHTNIFGFSL